MTDYYAQLDAEIGERKGPHKKSLHSDRTRNELLARSVVRLTFVTEVGRMIRDCVSDTIKRDRCYWKLIQSIDFSDEWHEIMAKKTLGQVLDMLLKGVWEDIQPHEVPLDDTDGEPGEPQEVL